MSLFQDIVSVEDHRVDAVLCGAKGWKAIKIFGEAQLDWLREYRDFSHGIPQDILLDVLLEG